MMNPNHDHTPSWAAAFKITTVYAIIGALWILCSGWLLQHFVHDGHRVAELEAVKGWFYVLVTAVLLGWWLNHYFRKIGAATELLYKSETRFTSIFNQHLEAVGISRLRDGVFVDVNEAFARLHGYRREEMVGYTSEQMQLWHSSNRQQVIAELREKKSLVFEMQARRKDGEVRDLLASLRLIELDGEPCLLDTLTDLTERKRAETALQETEERLRFALETSHTGAWDLDLADHTAFRSLEHDCIFGYEKLLPTWTYEMFLEHVLPEDRALVNEKFQRATETQSDWSFECRIRRVDGQVRWIWAAGRYRMDAGGKARRMGGIVQDITQRKAHECEIERLNRHYATLSQINQAIVRVKSHEELAREVTRVAIEFGGFKLAWIGRHDAQTREVTPLGSAGEPRQFVHNFHHNSGDAAEHRCPCGTAIRENRSCVSNDLSAATEMQDRLSEMGQAGIQAAAVFPIRVRGAAWGVFGVYASEPGVFQDKEISLLEEAALDIGYAIEHIENETQRRQAEAALLRSEAHLRTLVDTLPDLVWLKDPQGVYLTCNSRAETFFGAPEAEVVGKTDYDFFDRTQADFFRANDAAAVAAGGPRVNEEEGTFASDGHRELLETIKTPIFNPDGRLIGVLGIARDITERKQAEDDLRFAKSFLDSVIDSSPFAMWVADREGTITRANRSLCDAINLNQEQIVGKYSVLQDANLELQGVMPQVRAVFERGSPARFEIPWEASRAGSVDFTGAHDMHIDVSMFPILDVHGQLTSVVCQWVDITERKQAEESLRESEARFRSLIEGAPEAIFVQGGGTFQYVNRAMVELVGAARAEDLLGRPFLDCVASEFHEVIRERIRTQRETGAVAPLMEQEYLRPDGARVPVETTAVAIRFQGQDGHLVFVHDTAERREAEKERTKLEEQLRQAQKMESVGRLAGGAAHDFNNMLNIILGYGEMALDKLQKGDPLRDDVQEILAAGQRSAALTRQLLAFSRKQNLQPEILDFTLLVRDLDKMLRRVIGEDITLELALAENVGRVLADPGQIEQVILNLSVNARDAMPQGGKLLIETANVELDETYAAVHPGTLPGKYVLLAVTDTGCGVSKEILDKIFDPFFTTKEKGKGTGLGLSTVYGIVKQSGGNIWVYSEPGQGATFKIYLPQTLAVQESAAAKTEVKAHAKGREYILVVEDEQSLRKLITGLLSSLGYTVAAAASGGEALLLVEEKGLKPDLVVTDVVMPNMSGKVLIDRLRRNYPHLKALYMSGYTDNAIVHHGMLDPNTPFIQKPFSIHDFAKKLREVLECNS